MKKASKILSLLAVAAFATACNTKEKAPLVLSLNLDNAIALFNGNCRTPGKETPFALYKIDEEGVTERVDIKTKNSNDDKYYKENTIFTDLLDISDEYFYAHLDKNLGNTAEINEYFVNKKTGQAYKIDARITLNRLDYWYDSTSTYRDFPQDKDGNIYGYAYDYSAKSCVLGKYTVTDKKVKYERIGNVPENGLNNIAFNGFAVDNDGNVAYRGKEDGAISWKFVTPNKKVLPLESKAALWRGYDGTIYAYKDEKIEKITYNKDKNEIETTVVRAYPQLKYANLINSKLLYLDKTQQIYAYTTSSDYEFVLHQLYGENLLEEPIKYTTDDLSYPGASSNYFVQTYGYGYGGVDADEDCIYLSAYDGVDEFVINKIDTSKDMEHSQIRYSVEFNDGTRFLSNKKMLIFYWGYNDINAPEGNNGGGMSVGIFDINTATLSRQDRFVTGNAERSKVVNLKNYK